MKDIYLTDKLPKTMDFITIHHILWNNLLETVETTEWSKKAKGIYESGRYTIEQYHADCVCGYIFEYGQINIYPYGDGFPYIIGDDRYMNKNMEETPDTDILKNSSIPVFQTKEWKGVIDDLCNVFEGLTPKKMNTQIEAMTSAKEKTNKAIMNFMYFLTNYPTNWVSECFHNRIFTDKWNSICVNKQSEKENMALNFFMALSHPNQMRMIEWVNDHYDMG